MKRSFVTLLPVTAALILGLAAGPADAQRRNQQAAAPKETLSVDRDQINSNTITIISGNPNGTYLPFAFDIAAVLDQGDQLRILPVGGKGGYQNVKDLLWLRGVDVGITQSNILSYLRKTGEFGRGIEQRLTYITKLYNEEMHILAGDGINEITDLAGKTVNFSDAGSGTQFSSRLIFEALGIKVQEVNMGQGDAFEKIKSGEIAATVLIAGKPSGAFGRFKLEPGMKLLEVPYTEQLEADYFPSKLTSDDYPGLIEQGQSIDTISVGAVLATINWAQGSDRYRRVAKMTDALFAKFNEFKKAPRHPKWKEVDLTTELQGWTRFPHAKQLLDARPAPVTVAAAQSASGKKTFEQFLAEQKKAQSAGAAAATPAPPSNDPAVQALYAKFIEWMKTQPGGAAAVGAAAAPAAAQQQGRQSGSTRLW